MCFFAKDSTLVIVSGFIKKSRKTPDDELMLARKRMKEFLP